MKKLVLIAVATAALLGLTALYPHTPPVNDLALGITGSTSAPITVTTTAASTFIPFGQVRLTCTSPTYYSVNASSSTASTTSSSLAPGPVVVNNVTITRSIWLTVSSGTQWLSLLLKNGVQGTCIAEQVGTDGQTGSFTTLAASGATTLSSTLAVTGASSLSGAVTTGGVVDAGSYYTPGDATIVGNGTITGTSTLTGAQTLTGATTLGTSMTLPSSTALTGLKFGTVTLSSGTPSTATATVLSGMNCVCTNQTTQANPVKCAVSTTTLTVTGPNTVTDVVGYLCFK